MAEGKVGLLVGAVVFKAEGAGRHHGLPFEGPRDLGDQADSRKGRAQFKRKIVEQSPLQERDTTWRSRGSAANRAIWTVSAG